MFALIDFGQKEIGSEDFYFVFSCKCEKSELRIMFRVDLNEM